MPRHIACLSYDFDTWSGFAARGVIRPLSIPMVIVPTVPWPHTALNGRMRQRAFSEAVGT
jgi:hypothetical protein